MDWILFRRVVLRKVVLRKTNLRKVLLEDLVVLINRITSVNEKVVHCESYPLNISSIFRGVFVVYP